MTLAVEFVRNLRQSKGQWAGQPLDVLPWQSDVLSSIFGTIKDDGTRRYRTAYVEVPRKNGKALALDTPVLTDSGWRTQGSLAAGDVVFDEQGYPCTVVAVGPVQHDRPCFRLAFSDDTSIVADAEHEWFTVARSRCGESDVDPAGGGIRTTERIGATLRAHEPAGSDARHGWNHEIALPGAPTVQIVACDAVASVPVRCIQVNSPSRLYLAGTGCIPTHNSTLAAGIGLYALLADDEGGPEVYLAAVDRDQASIVFDVIREMVRQDVWLSKELRVIPSQRRIQYPGKAGVLRVIAADAAGSHGFNASCVIADEVHAWPSRELWDVLQTSMGARRQPLMIGITTAGFEANSLGGQLHEYAERVRDGVVDDPAFLPVLYGAAPDEPWDDPAVWRRANPSLGHTITEEYLAGECARAKAVPAYESAFRRLHLCQWVNQETRYLPMEAWSDCAGGVTPAELETELEGEVCYGGLDLSATTDLTALVLVFPRGDGTYDVVPRFWLPADDLKRRCERDRVPYDVWARQGLLTLTPGNVVDYAHVRAEVNALAKRYVLGGVSYDRWAATQLVQELVADGIDMAPMSQGMASMAAPTKELLTLSLGRRLRHANHPILRWQADNLVVVQDAAGNVRPAKHKARQRIDGMVALVMGIDRASRNAGAAQSVYEERGMLVL